MPRHFAIPRQEAVSVVRRLRTADTARYHYRLCAKRRSATALRFVHPPRCAIEAAAVDGEGVGAHRADSERKLAIVTPSVTHGDGAHAPTARASVAVGATS